MFICKLRNGAAMDLPDPTKRKTARQRHLAGWLDLAGYAVQETAPRVRGAHRQIANRVFDQLHQLPPAQPFVAVTRTLHDLISELSYSAVTWAGSGTSYLARLYYQHPDRNRRDPACAAGRKPAGRPQWRAPDSSDPAATPTPNHL